MKSDGVLKRLSLVLVGAAALAAGAPTHAQQVVEPDIDAMIDASSSPDAAMVLARRQADQGDLTGAAATLERALLNRPKLRSASVPLYYVSILCRLDDRQRANIELARVRGLRIDDADWSVTQAACGNIERPSTGRDRNGASITGEVAAGLAYDTDTSGALAIQFDFPGLPNVRDDGFAFIGSARIDARAPVSDDGYLYFGASGLTRNDISGPPLDYQLANVRAGYGFQTNGFGLSLGPVAHFARLQEQDYFAEYGGQAEISVTAGSGRFALRGEVVHQDYAGSLPFFDRDGTRTDIALDYQQRSIAGLIWVVGGAFEHKIANSPNFGLAYDGGRIYAAARLPLNASGTYADLSATVRYIDHQAAPFGLDRKEIRSFTRAAIGTPLWGRGLDIEAAASYTRRDFNQTSRLRDYDSVGAELRLIWNFGS